MNEHEPSSRSAPSSEPEHDASRSADAHGVRWEVRRNRSPWQNFLEKFGFTLIAIGIAMLVGVLIARMG